MTFKVVDRKRASKLNRTDVKRLAKMMALTATEEDLLLTKGAVHVPYRHGPVGFRYKLIELHSSDGLTVSVDSGMGRRYVAWGDDE